MLRTSILTIAALAVAGVAFAQSQMAPPGPAAPAYLIAHVQVNDPDAIIPLREKSANTIADALPGVPPAS